MAIVTISRQIGSLGDDIAKAVAEMLKYAYVDKSKISDALAEQGFSAPEFEKFDEKKPTLWQSLSDQTRRFTFFLRGVVYDFAQSDNVIIVGRGGQILLKDIPGALHVRVVAPLEQRKQRLLDLADNDEKKAEKLLLQSDRDSAGFTRAFFDVDWNDEILYDLLLNTRTMSVGTATSLICAAISATEYDSATTEESNLADKALLQKARGVLVGYPGVDLTRIEVTHGVVVLSGLARSKENIETCQKKVSEIKGVKEVRSKLEIVPIAGV